MREKDQTPIFEDETITTQGEAREEERCPALSRMCRVTSDLGEAAIHGAVKVTGITIGEGVARRKGPTFKIALQIQQALKDRRDND